MNLYVKTLNAKFAITCSRSPTRLLSENPLQEQN